MLQNVAAATLSTFFTLRPTLTEAEETAAVVVWADVRRHNGWWGETPTRNEVKADLKLIATLAKAIKWRALWLLLAQWLKWRKAVNCVGLKECSGVEERSHSLIMTLTCTKVCQRPSSSGKERTRSRVIMSYATANDMLMRCAETPASSRLPTSWLRLLCLCCWRWQLTALLTVGWRLVPLGAPCEILIENLMRFTLLSNKRRKARNEKRKYY